jgi:hypothetical protein
VLCKSHCGEKVTGGGVLAGHTELVSGAKKCG